jgi:hypothetical protein
VFSVSDGLCSTPDKEELETIRKAGNPLLSLLTLLEKGTGKGDPLVVVARVSPGSGKLGTERRNIKVGWSGSGTLWKLDKDSGSSPGSSHTVNLVQEAG